MFRKLRNRLANFRLSMRMKLTLSLSAIAVVLLLSSIISIIEYRRMSNYVSELIADNINSINVAQQLTNVVDEYNLDILTVIGDETISTLPDFDQKAFVAYCDSLKVSMTEKKLLPLADSVLYSYSAYMLTSLELNDVLLSDFIDSRTWYFDRLQPVFGRLREDIDDLSLAIYNDLEKNSVAFDNGFYRSIIPSAVAVSVGILLVLLLLFFILAYYVKPIYKMLDSLDNYRSFNRKYNYTFEGDDELTDLNAGILELTEENSQMRRRLKEIKSKESGE
jgi:predicted PurR-regulated permease PerM